MNAPRQLSGRGLSYWTDGKGDDRVIYVTTGYRLVSLNAKTGVPVAGFGTNGVVDMKVGAVVGKGTQIDLEKRRDRPALDADRREGRDPRRLVVPRRPDRQDPQQHQGSRSRVGREDRQAALDVQHDSRARASSATTRGKKSRGRSTATPASGRRSRSTKSSGSSICRSKIRRRICTAAIVPGNNLFGDSLVCVDLKTGQRKWHFQIVHHPIWDYDMPAAPLLADIVVDGKPIKAVAQATKQGLLYVFDRVTGQPVWPIEERPVPQTDVPGEKTAPTQPFPTKPPAYSRNGVVESDLIDFTPELKAQGLEVAKRYRLGPVFLPPLVSKAEGPLGALTSGTLSGGVNWPGSAYDPEMHAFFTHACNACIAPLGLVAPPKDFSDLDYVMGTAGADVPPDRRRRRRRSRRRAAAGARGAAPPPPPTPPPRGQRPADAARARGRRGGRRRIRRDRAGSNIVKPPYGVIVGDQPRQGRADVVDAARRHARRRSQPPGASRRRTSRRPASRATSASS